MALKKVQPLEIVLETLIMQTTKLVLLFFSAFGIYSSTTSPIEQGSGSGAYSPQTTLINCSKPRKSSTKFSQILAGLKVLEKFSYITAFDNMQELLSISPISCTTPVNYKNAKTLALSATENNIAKWYTVFNSFTEYFNTLQPDTTEHGEELQTFQTLLSALKGDFIDLLQDFHCNCTSSSCVIEDPSFTAISENCLYPLTYIELLFNIEIISEARFTVKEFVKTCGCQDSNDGQPDALDWFNKYFPLDSSFTDKMMLLLSP